MRHILTPADGFQPARVTVLTGILFLILGVLGMHVLPGAHNTPEHAASPVPSMASHAVQSLPGPSPAGDSESAMSQEVAPAFSAAQPVDGEAAGAMMTVCQPTAADPDCLIPPDEPGTTTRPDGGPSPQATSLTTQLIRPPSHLQLSIIRT